MALKLTNDTNYTAIANAIRGKNGLSTNYKPSEMAQAITDIPSGGNETPIVTFSNAQRINISTNPLITHISVELPEQYQPVTYIKLNENSIINTGYIINNEDIKIECILRCDTDHTNPFGSATDADTNLFNPYVRGGGYNDWLWYAGDSYNLFPNVTYKNTVNSIIFETNNHIVTLNGSNSTTYGGSIINGSNPISIGGIIISGVSSRMTGQCYIYKFKVTVNGTVELNLVPCYKKSDNTPGLFDTVNNTFITNYGNGTIDIGNIII